MTGASPAPETRATPRQRRERGRGVTDMVGYVLMVGVILVGVGLTATVGVGHLEDAQLTQNTRSIERGMLLVEDGLDEIQESQASSRSSSISLAGGDLSINGSDAPSSVLVNVSGTGDSPTRYRMGAMRYELEDTTVAYESGGVFLAAERGSPITRAAPTFICDDERAIVSIVTLQGAAANRSYAGGEADVVVRENASRVRFPVNRSGADSQARATGVNVTVDSAYAAAWRDYLLNDDQEWVEQPGGPNLRFRCAPSTELVYVRQTVVDVSVRRGS